MKSVLKKIFEEDIDQEVHDEFLKFGRGRFENKYLLEGKKQKDKWSIKTGSEFSNFLVKKLLENEKGEIEINGVIVCTFDIRGDIGFEVSKVKQFMGVKQFIIKCKTEVGKIIDLMNKYPKAHYGLSFKTKDCELKIKPKTPKSAKPAAKGESGPKVDFCALKTSDKNIIDDLFFDFPEFKEIKIKNTLLIDSVILPEGEKDPVKIREMAKKKGKIIREIEVDGRIEKKEKDFEI